MHTKLLFFWIIQLPQKKKETEPAETKKLPVLIGGWNNWFEVEMLWLIYWFAVWSSCPF